MFALFILASLAATAYSAYSSYSANQAASKQAEYNADYNAKIAENEAEQERLNRGAQELEERKAANRKRAYMEGRYAKSGILLTGTPADFLSEQAAADEYNIQEGNRVSNIAQDKMKAQSGIIRQQGAADASAYSTAATTAIINGLGSAAGTIGAAGLQSGKTPSPDSTGGYGPLAGGYGKATPGYGPQQQASGMNW